MCRRADSNPGSLSCADRGPLALVNKHYGAMVLGMPKEISGKSASAPELVATSESEQMYLITVARAAEAGNEGPVSISAIADALGVSVPSANEMVRKLDNRGLLSYEPYHGVLLSDAGSRIADQVLRTRRLWATFLAEHLGFSPSAADDQACDLEHSTSPEAAERLATFLGNPAAGPLGRRIPSSNPDVARVTTTTKLAELLVGQTGEVCSLAAADPHYAFLSAEGITVGSRLTVQASGRSGLLLSGSNGDVHVSHAMAAEVNVMVVRSADASA